MRGLINLFLCIIPAFWLGFRNYSIVEVCIFAAILFTSLLLFGRKIGEFSVKATRVLLLAINLMLTIAITGTGYLLGSIASWAIL